MDLFSAAARANQARVINEDAQAYPHDYPQVLTGDMNCDAGGDAIAEFKAAGWLDSYGAVHGDEDPGPTYHGFRGPDIESDTGKIDWIFWRGPLKAVEASIVRDSPGGRFPSDHYFVAATLTAMA